MNIETFSAKMTAIAEALSAVADVSSKKENLEAIDFAIAEADGLDGVIESLRGLRLEVDNATTLADIFDGMVDGIGSDMEVYDCGDVTVVNDGTDSYACLTADYEFAHDVLADTLAGEAEEEDEYNRRNAGTVAYQALCDQIVTTFGTASGANGSTQRLRELAEAIVAAAALEGNEGLAVLAEIAAAWLADHAAAA